MEGRDIQALCHEAITHMVREMNPGLEEMESAALERYSLHDRPLSRADFEQAFQKIKPGSAPEDVQRYDRWREKFGG